jgi:hypothetical protein
MTMTIGESLAVRTVRIEALALERVLGKFPIADLEIFAEPYSEDGLRFHVKRSTGPLPADCFLRDVSEASDETIAEVAAGNICSKLRDVPGLPRRK